MECGSFWGCLYETTPVKAQESIWKRGRKRIRARNGARLQENSVFRFNRADTHMNSQRVACTRHAQAQAGQTPSMEEGKRHEVPPKAKKLFITVS